MAVDQAQGMDISRYTRELVPSIVDHPAEATPNALYEEYLVLTLNYKEGYRRTTHGDLARRRQRSDMVATRDTWPVERV